MPRINWYLIFTRPSSEQKVADQLSKRGIEIYCPTKKVVQVSGNNRTVFHQPLFSTYIFAKLNALRLNEVRKIDGVVNFVYWLDQPAVIRDIEIEMMRRFLNEHTNVQLEKTAVNVNEMVKLTSGAFVENEIDHIKVRTEVVKLVLPSIGYSFVAEVIKDNIEVIVKSAPVHYNTSSMENALDFGL